MFKTFNDYQGNVINIGDEVKVIGEVFPNIRGYVYDVQEETITLEFMYYYGKNKLAQWNFVTIPKANIVKIVKTSKDRDKKLYMPKDIWELDI